MRHLLLAVAAVCGACSLPFAGGALEGEVAPAPADWTALAARDVVQLETRPDDPYSVNVWVIGAGPRVYVFAGASRSNWVEHIEADPAVRLGIGGQIYPLRADRVSDPVEFTSFADAWELKYGHRPLVEDAVEAYLFRLTPR